MFDRNFFRSKNFRQTKNFRLEKCSTKNFLDRKKIENLRKIENVEKSKKSWKITKKPNFRKIENFDFRFFRDFWKFSDRFFWNTPIFGKNDWSRLLPCGADSSIWPTSGITKNRLSRTWYPWSYISTIDHKNTPLVFDLPETRGVFLWKWVFLQNRPISDVLPTKITLKTPKFSARRFAAGRFFSPSPLYLHASELRGGR